MGLNLELNKPIRVKNRDVHQLAIRDPVTKDFFDIGLPMVVISLGDGEVRGLEFRMKVLALFIGRLAGIPPDAVKSMAMQDVGKCQAFILSFLDDFGGGVNHG